MGSSEQAIVAFDGVSKRFGRESGEFLALDDVTLSIRRGEIFGVIGESGAGKSTLMEMINGLTVPDAGTVTVEGVRPARLSRWQLRALRHRVGMVFQGIHLLSSRTVRQNVALSLALVRRSRAGGEFAMTRDEERRAVDEMLAFVGLSHRADHYPAQLSGGERQRVGLARALVARPPVLLCDEPTSSLDASTTADVLRVLLDARDQLGTTIVVITHDLDVVAAVCDRAALLERGRVRELFDVAKRDYRTLPTYHEQVRRELMS